MPRLSFVSGLALTLCGLAHRALGAEPPPAVPAPTLCQLNEPNCGSAKEQCFTEGLALQRNEEVQLCVGFQSANSTRVQIGKKAGKKAVFTTTVDEYATLSVDTLAPIMQGASFDAKKDYQFLWVGARNKRTIGQEFGWKSEDGESCLTVPPAAKVGKDRDCIGWRLHNKPLVTGDGYLINSITAIIHLSMGKIKTIVWDSGCNLCGRGSEGLKCMDDNTTVACTSSWWGGSAVDCKDCYADISRVCETDGSGCAPKIYFAWVGTDKHGQNMLSAGRVLSRFAAGSVQGAVSIVKDEVDELKE